MNEAKVVESEFDCSEIGGADNGVRILRPETFDLMRTNQSAQDVGIPFLCGLCQAPCLAWALP